MFYYEGNFKKMKSMKSYAFYSPRKESRINSNSNYKEKILKYFSSRIRLKSNKMMTKIKGFKIDKNPLPSKATFNIITYKKEKENEKRRQYILNRIRHNYAQGIAANYNIMFITNILSNKSNSIKSRFIELLNIIETKELLNNYYLRGESKIKLAYLTKLFSKNIRIYPNYIKNIEIYPIMSKNLIEKEKLIQRIENNKRINVLKLKLLKFINNDKYKDKDKSEIKFNKKDISLTDSENIDLEENLNYLNDDDSFSNSFRKKNDSFNKIQNLIDDISLFLNKYDKDNDIDIVKENKQIKKENININLNSIDIGNNILNNINICNEQKYKIKKNKLNIKSFSFYKNKKIKNLVFADFIQNNKKMVKFQTNNDNKDTSKEIRYNNVIKTEKNISFKNNEKYNINFQTIENKIKIPLILNSDKNLSKNNFNTISNNLDIFNIKTIPSTFRKKYFKPTNIFLDNIYKNKKNMKKSKITYSIVNIVRKFGLSKNLNENAKGISILNRNKKSKKNFSQKKLLNFEVKNILSLIQKKDKGKRNIPIYG